MDFISTSPQPAALLVLADAAIKSAALLVVAGIASPLMRKSSAAARHVLWSGALSGALLLPVLSFFLPAWRVPWLPDWTPPAIVEASNTSPAISAAPVIAQSPAESEAAMAQNKEAFIQQLTTIRNAALLKGDSSLNTQPPTQPFHWRNALSFIIRHAYAIWLIGAALALMPMLAGWTQAALVTRRGQRLDDASWSALLDHVTRELKLRRRVRLLVCTGAAMPFTWGAWRPVVIFPETVSAWSESRRRIVLLHELAHIERWDWLTQTLAAFACALYWFNPVAWLAAKRMRVEREQACDDLVLRAGSRPSDYADELLQLASTARHSGFLNFAAVPMARHSTLEGRLLAILDGRRNRATLTRAALLAILALVALVVVPVAMLRAAPSVASSETLAKEGAPTQRLASTPLPPLNNSISLGSSQAPITLPDLSQNSSTGPTAGIFTASAGNFNSSVVSDNSVVVAGDVNKESVLTLELGQNLTVSQAIAQAGGFNSNANHTVTIWPKYQPSRLQVGDNVPDFKRQSEDVDAVLNGTHPEQDIKLTPGDSILVGPDMNSPRAQALGRRMQAAANRRMNQTLNGQINSATSPAGAQSPAKPSTAPDDPSSLIKVGAGSHANEAMVFIPLKNARAQDLAATMTALQSGPLLNYLGNSTVFQTDGRTNQLIVISNISSVVLAQNIVKALDVDISTFKDPSLSQANEDMLFIPLKNTQAQSMAATMMALQNGPLSNYLGNSTVFQAEARTNQLVAVTSKSKSELIRSIATALDAQTASAPASAAQMDIIQLIEKGTAQYLVADYQGALDSFNQVTASDPNNMVAKAYLLEIRGLLPGPDQPRAKKNAADLKLLAIIPNATFDNVPFDDVIRTLSQLSQTYDPVEPKSGVTMVTPQRADGTFPKVSLSLHGDSLRSILNDAATAAGYSFTIGDDGVITFREGPAWDRNGGSRFELGHYRILVPQADFLAKISGAAGNETVAADAPQNKSAAIKYALSRFGVGFPFGSGLLYNSYIGSITVINTRENLDKITVALNKLEQPDTKELPPAATDATTPAPAMHPGQVKAVLAQGNITLTKADGTTSKLERTNTFGEGDTLAADTDGTALLVFSNGASFKISPRTSLKVTRFQQAPFDEAAYGTFLRIGKDPSKSTVVLDLHHEAPADVVTQANVVARSEYDSRMMGKALAGEVKQLNSEAGSTFTINYHDASFDSTAVGDAPLRGVVINTIIDSPNTPNPGKPGALPVARLELGDLEFISFVYGLKLRPSASTQTPATPPAPPPPPAMAPDTTAPAPANPAVNDKAPVLGDIPVLGNLFRANGQTSIPSASTIAPPPDPAPPSSVTSTSTTTPASKEAINQLLVKGKAEFLKGDYQSSLDTFSQIAALDPTNIVAKAYTYDIQKILVGTGSIRDRLATRGQMLKDVQNAQDHPEQYLRGYNISVAPKDAPIVLKLNSITIPNVNFDTVSLDKLIASLAILSAQYDPAHTGVNMVVTPRADGTFPKIPLSIRDASFKTILNNVAETAGYSYTIGSDDIITFREGSGAGPYSFRTFPLPATTFAYLTGLSGAHKPSTSPAQTNPSSIGNETSAPDDTDSDTIKNALIKLGVDFPPGSGLLYNSDIHSVAVFNLPANLDKMASVLGQLAQPAPGTPPPAMHPGQVKAVIVQGNITLTKADGTVSTIKRNNTFTEGDTLTADTDGTALLVFSNGASLKFNNNAKLKVTQFQQDPFDESANGTFLRLEKDPSKSTVVLDVFHGQVAGEIKQINIEAGSTFTINYHGASANGTTGPGVQMRGAIINNIADTAGDQVEVNVPTNPPSGVVATITANGTAMNQAVTQREVDAIYQTINAARAQDNLPPITTPVATATPIGQQRNDLVLSFIAKNKYIRTIAYFIEYPADTKLEVPDDADKVTGYLKSSQNFELKSERSWLTTSGREILGGPSNAKVTFKPQWDNGNVSYAVKVSLGNVTDTTQAGGAVTQNNGLKEVVSHGTTPLNHPITLDLGPVTDTKNSYPVNRAMVFVFSDSATKSQPQSEAAPPQISGAPGQVVISGEVNKPALLPVPTDGNLTVSQAILTAGGFTDWSNHTIVLYHTGNDGKVSQQNVNVDFILNGHPEKDVKVESGDIIFVKKMLFVFDSGVAKPSGIITLNISGNLPTDPNYSYPTLKDEFYYPKLIEDFKSLPFINDVGKVSDASLDSNVNSRHVDINLTADVSKLYSNTQRPNPASRAASTPGYPLQVSGDMPTAEPSGHVVSGSEITVRIRRLLTAFKNAPFVKKAEDESLMLEFSGAQRVKFKFTIEIDPASVRFSTDNAQSAAAAPQTSNEPSAKAAERGGNATLTLVDVGRNILHPGNLPTSASVYVDASALDW